MEFWDHLSEFDWTRSNLKNAPRFEELKTLLFEKFSSVQLGSNKLLRPLSASQAKPNSLSSFVGTSEQPLHTDCAYMPNSPRYMLLKCVSNGEQQCPTKIGRVFWDRLEAEMPTEFYHSIWTFSDSIHNRFYSSIIRGKGKKAKIRFDPFCMNVPNSEEYSTIIVEKIMKYVDKREEYLDEGQWLLINNWRILHGRSTGAEFSPSRKIERSYWS